MQVELLDVADPATAEELLRLQRAAYAVEAALLGDDRIPQLREDLAGLQAAPLRWLGGREGRVLVAAVAWDEADGVVDVHRLVVAPEQHGRGLGRALMTALLGRTRGPVEVSTGRDNTPACRLYASLGFVGVGDAEVVPGLWVRRFSLER